MRKKRLNHCADVLCRMFRGWRLHSDWDALVRLGTGVLKIDILGEGCRHNDKSIPPLNIAQSLRDWLFEDLSTHQIPLNAIIEAKLEIEFELGPPEPTPSGPGVPCSFRCCSQISTDEMVYTSTYEDQYPLTVSPDALRLEKREKDKLIQECFRMA